jgi:predicted transposase/invertase (TIGR01784 family)
MSFLRYYLHFESPEMFAKFGQEIAVLSERKVTMGIEEFLLDRAKKEGREEVINETALKMKKNGLDISLIANITGLSIEEIEKLS